MKNFQRSLIIFALLGLLAGCASGAVETPLSEEAPENVTESAPLVATQRPSGISYVNPVNYQVTYSVAVSGGNFDFSRLIVFQPRPVVWDAQQDVVIIGVSPEATAEGLDAIGNGMYNWDLANYPATGKTESIMIRFSLTALETLTNLTSQDVQAYDTGSELYQDYTSAEKYIESDDPAIKAKAIEIAAGEINPLLVTRKIYDYIIQTMLYKKTGQGLAGAKSLFETGKGECGDYSALFIALSRASGIPARSVVGYWAVTGLDQTHVWAEFYLQGFGWIPVDATIGQLDPAKRNYYFGNMDNQRIILNKGFNIQLSPAAPDNFAAAFLQVPYFWFWGNGDAKQVTLERHVWSVISLP